MDSHWSSLLVVAAVFAAFSGTASAWGHLQRRKRGKQEAAWLALLQAEGNPLTSSAAAPGRAMRGALPPDPGFADGPSFATDSDSRRAALDGALERMSRQAPSAASNSADWEDTEPSVSLSTALPHAVGRRDSNRGSEAA
jgi:hypothetical protein